MNKEDIKKAIKCCFDYNCAECPNAKIKGYGCKDKLHADALNLITEQEKEIERLKAENEKVYAVRDNLLKENDELIKTNAELLLLPKQAVKQAKIEVLNELWEKVKDKGVDYKIGMRALSEEIDELIKEIDNADKD